MCSLPYVYNFRFKEQEQQVLVDRSYVFSQENNIIFFVNFFFYCVQSFGFTQNFEISFSITASSFISFWNFSSATKMQNLVRHMHRQFAFNFFRFRSNGSEFCGIYFLILTNWSDFSYMPQHTHFLIDYSHTKITQSTASQIQFVCGLNIIYLCSHSFTVIGDLFDFWHKLSKPISEQHS